jgi:hypothetical protein
MLRVGCRALLGNAFRGGPSLALVLVAVVGALPAVAEASSPPSIYSESVSHLTPTDATLEAQIDPQEAVAGDHYQFQLVANPGVYASEILCPVKLPPGWDGCQGTQSASALPIGFIPGNSAQPGRTLLASVDLASAGVTLEPATTYHYRVLAARRVQTEDTIAWEPPTVFGSDQTFTTPAEGSPWIAGESVSDITPTDATLEAQINPDGLQTTYEFRLETPVCQEEEGPGPIAGCEVVGTGTIPAGTSTQTVSTDIAKAWQGLYPNSRYFYFVRAKNSAGEAYSTEQEFRTPPALPPSIESESFSHRTSTDAVLEAQINTEGRGSTYTFYLQNAEPLCLKAHPPCEIPQYEPLALPAGNLLGSPIGQSVSADLNSAGVSLSPGQAYEYWVTATNAAGTTPGPAQEFTAPEDAGQPQSTPPPPTTGGGAGTSSTLAGQGASPGVTPPGSSPVCLCDCRLGCHANKVSARHQTGPQKLSKTLKACAKKPKSKRAACQKQAHKKYDTTAKKSQK